MPESPQEKFRSYLEEFDNAMLVTRAEDDSLRSRPMVIAGMEENSDLWFITSLTSPKVEEMEAEPEVCVTMQGGNKFLSLSGRVRLVRDREKIDELWKEAWKAWFPEGKDDPSLILLRVRANEGEYWDNSGADGIKYLFEAGKAYLAGERPEPGQEQHQKMRL